MTWCCRCSSSVPRRGSLCGKSCAAIACACNWPASGICPIIGRIYRIVCCCAIPAGAMSCSAQSAMPRPVGECYALRVELVSRFDGLLTDIPYRRLQLFEHVRSGDIVLRLDDQLVRASLVTLGKSLDEAKAALTKAEEQIR